MAVYRITRFAASDMDCLTSAPMGQNSTIAISRAENRLLILTDEGLKSPYLKQIKGDPFLTDVERKEETIHQLLPGSVAEKIQAKIKRTVSVVI